MKTEVVTVASYTPKESYYIFESFKASLRKLGAEPTILGWQQEWRGLMTKSRRYREFLRKGHQTGDILIVCDAYDVLFQAPPDEIGQKYLERWPDQPLVLNAERNCFPLAHVAGDFELVAAAAGATTPWKYLNGGFIVGPPDKVLGLFEAMNLDEIPDDHQLYDGSWVTPNDQEHFTLAFLKQPVPMVLDYNTELCMACHGSQIDEFDWSGDRIKNLITGTVPGAFHFNGSGKQCPMPEVMAKLGV